MKKVNRKFFTIFAAVATVFATLVASSACALSIYQPEEPKCLRDE